MPVDNHSDGKPGVMLAHPSGNQFFRHAAIALRDAGLLDSLYTCLNWRPFWRLEKLLPHGMAAELKRRSFSQELGISVEQHPYREAVRLLAGRLGMNILTRHETGPFCVDAVYRDFDQWVARCVDRSKRAGAVYAYEDAAEATFLAAIKRGWKRVYDLPIAYWETSRRLLNEEAQRLPAWEPTLGGTRDSSAKLNRKTHELMMADLVICPSRFVADSLPNAIRSENKVLIAPFGSPQIGLCREPNAPKQPLRLLFAGSMGQRKGLADLFAAMRLLKTTNIELVILGSPLLPPMFYRQESGKFIYERPRPHAEVLALMRTCDVFCLPSIVEGRALVIQEAMSQGLPAIVTPNTGANDVVEDFKSGFVVPIRSPAMIAEKIDWFASHRDMLPEMGRAAQQAAAKLTWNNYGDAIISELRRLIC